MKMIRNICLVLCLLPVNVFGQEINDSNIDNNDLCHHNSSIHSPTNQLKFSRSKISRMFFGFSNFG